MEKNITNNPLLIRYMGLMHYNDASQLQNELHELRREEKISDVLLFLEHHHVITLGTRGNESDILASKSTLEKENVSINKTNRGGEVTLHTPGQLVGYFIFHLSKRKGEIRNFIQLIEQTLIKTLASFGIEGRHDEKLTGVWVKNNKIASIGISISRGVTQHGFALNVSNNLDTFKWIVPCGLSNTHITSMKKQLNATPSMKSICDIFVENLTQKRLYSDIIKDTTKMPEW